MSQFAVVYWSGTGNTKAMANLVAQGIERSGHGVDVLTASEMNASLVSQYEGIAFGCPAMGAEQLEESEFAPMFEEVKPELSGKKVVLFGSYGWGDGEWMRSWQEECEGLGVQLMADPLIVQEAPDNEEECMELGEALVA